MIIIWNYPYLKRGSRYLSLKFNVHITQELYLGIYMFPSIVYVLKNLIKWGHLCREHILENTSNHYTSWSIFLLPMRKHTACWYRDIKILLFGWNYGISKIMHMYRWQNRTTPPIEDPLINTYNGGSCQQLIFRGVYECGALHEWSYAFPWD